MGLLLVLVNVAFAGLVALVVWRWREARELTTTPLDPEGTVSIRLLRRPWDEDEVERCVRRSLEAVALVPTGDGGWGGRAGAVARVSPPVLGDRATLIEVSSTDADQVVSCLVAALLDEGYELSRQRGRRVSMRRGPDRVLLQVGPA